MRVSVIIFAFRLVSIHVGRRLVTQQAELLRVDYIRINVMWYTFRLKGKVMTYLLAL